MFFYGYVHEGYHDNNVNGYFTYLSGYAGSGTARSSLVVFHPEGEFTHLFERSTRHNTVWLLGRRDHEDVGKVKIFKD